MIALLPLIIGGAAFILMQQATDWGMGTMYFLTALIVFVGYGMIIKRVVQTQNAKPNTLNFYKDNPENGRRTYYGNAVYFQGTENMLGESYLKIRLRRFAEVVGAPYPLRAELYLNGRHIQNVEISDDKDKQRFEYDQMLEAPDFNRGSTLEVRYQGKTVLEGRFGSGSGR